MPYLKTEDKARINETLMKFLRETKLNSPGELNYIFTMICKKYLVDKGENYQAHNDILGAFDGASKEWYRRKVAPYEDKKVKENGDVF